MKKEFIIFMMMATTIIVVIATGIYKGNITFGKIKPTKPIYKTECRQGVLYYVESSYNRQSLALHYTKGESKPTQCKELK